MENTYLKVVTSTREMAGKGAPRNTVFGVLGHTMESSMTKSLGGLVEKSSGGKVKKGVAESVSKEPKNTENKILGPKSHTAIPGSHMGQVPYAGYYMKAVGERL
jgi:hypothetical protein